MGKHFTRKSSKLLFRPEGDCAIIHAVAFSFRLDFAPCIVQENRARRPHFFSCHGGLEIAKPSVAVAERSLPTNRS